MAEEYLHSSLVTGRDIEAGGKAIVVPAGTPVSKLKLDDEELDRLRDAGVVRAEKYEEVADNSTVGAAPTLEEREAGEGSRVTSSR